MASFVAVAIVLGACFIAYLVFCGFAIFFVLRSTGSTDGLRDVALMVRIFRDIFRLPGASQLQRRTRHDDQSYLDFGPSEFPHEWSYFDRLPFLH